MNRNMLMGALDFFSLMSLGLMSLIAEPEQPAILHLVETLPNSSRLLALTGTSYLAYRSGHWINAENIGDDNKLYINCNNYKECLALVGSQVSLPGEVSQLILELPVENKQKARDLFYESCAINKNCSGVTIVHQLNEVTLYSKNKDLNSH